MTLHRLSTIAKATVAILLVVGISPVAHIVTADAQDTNAAQPKAKLADAKTPDAKPDNNKPEEKKPEEKKPDSTDKKPEPGKIEPSDKSESKKTDDAPADPAQAAAQQRILESIKYLASDELEGRGIGTKGLEKAGDYLAAEFAKLGLKTDLIGGKPFQTFQMTAGVKMGPTNNATLTSPAPEQGKPPVVTELKLGQDFTPLSIGISGKFDAPLVFAGYGITSKDHKYDDYEGIDAKGKVVIVLRKEPQQGNPHSTFEGTQNTRHAFYTTKLSNAAEHGAVAVIFLNDDYELSGNQKQAQKTWRESLDKLVEEHQKFTKIEKPSDEQVENYRKSVEKLIDQVKSTGANVAKEDRLLKFDEANAETPPKNIPAMHFRRSVIDPIIKAALKTDLATLEAEIDKGLKPQSKDIPGYKMAGEVTVQKQGAEVRNVVAVLEGEGPKADETIVIGAHYDHLGFGGFGSFTPTKREIHNGADDNGSGTATLLEVAKQIVSTGKKPPRRIVFIAFTAEERGLIGSNRYVNSPIFPIEKTVAMLNMDMVGRLRDDKLTIYGTGTAKEFDGLVNKLGAKHNFKVSKEPSGFGPSDHTSFYTKKVPVLHFFTGMHSDYHRPSDDFEKLNIAGMRRIAALVSEAALTIADGREKPAYMDTKGSITLARTGSRPYFGSIPADFGGEKKDGYALGGVAENSPAAKAVPKIATDGVGLKNGDAIVKLGENKITNLDDFDAALRKFKGGDKVVIAVKRGDKEINYEVTLDAPRN